MKKRQCKNLQRRQEKIKKVEETLDKLSQLGIVSKPQIINGERAYRIEPRGQEFMLWVLQHPEKWDEAPGFAARKADLMDLHNKAIANGLINP